MTVREMIAQHFRGDRHKAAKGCGTTINSINNWVSQNKSVLELKDGRFILEDNRMKIFQKEQT